MFNTASRAVVRQQGIKIVELVPQADPSQPRGFKEPADLQSDDFMALIFSSQIFSGYNIS